MCSIMRNASSLVLFFILNYVLISKVIITESIVSLIHYIPLKNATNIPEEYKDLPVVGKCCSMDQTLSLNQINGSICNSLNSSESLFNPMFFEFNSSTISGMQIIEKKQDSLVALVGYPCLYDSFPINDLHYLLLNGSIYYPIYKPSMLMPGKDYCMEYIAELGLQTNVCFSNVNISDVEVKDIKVANSGKFVIVFSLLTSSIFLILTILAYNITPKLRDIYGYVASHYCGCLTMAFILITILQLGSLYWTHYTCLIISYVVQFFFLASYTWMNVLCIVTNNLIRHYVNHARLLRKTTKTLFFYYSLYAWGSPAILIIADMFLNFNPTRFTTESDNCWIDSNIKSTWLYFFPVLISIVNNLIIFIFTGITIRRFKSDLKFRLLTRNKTCDRRDKKMLCILNISFMAPLITFFFLTLTWILEFISLNCGYNSFNRFPIYIVIALHGCSVFVVFVLRRPIRDLVWARMQRLRGSDKFTPRQTIINNPYILNPLTRTK